MRKVLLTFALTLTFAATLLNAAKRDFQIGKLVSVAEDERVDEGTSYRWAIFTVQIGDLVYTTRGDEIGQGLIVGDAVRAAIEGAELILLKPDGKELETKIIKRARAQ